MKVSWKNFAIATQYLIKTKAESKEFSRGWLISMRDLRMFFPRIFRKHLMEMDGVRTLNIFVGTMAM